ncbi:uncharacterized protein LOC144422736 [Styela clava]
MVKRRKIVPAPKEAKEENELLHLQIQVLKAKLRESEEKQEETDSRLQLIDSRVQQIGSQLESVELQNAKIGSSFEHVYNMLQDISGVVKTGKVADSEETQPMSHVPDVSLITSTPATVVPKAAPVLKHDEISDFGSEDGQPEGKRNKFSQTLEVKFLENGHVSNLAPTILFLNDNGNEGTNVRRQLSTRPKMVTVATQSVPPVSTSRVSNANVSRSVLNSTTNATMMARNAKKPMYFDGSTVMTWPSYLCHFELVTSYNQWDDDTAGLELATCMTGQALNVLKDLPDMKRTSYRDIVAHFNHYFKPAGNASSYRTTFHCRRIKPNEAPRDYGNKLKELVILAYPNLDIAGQDDILKSQFLAGLTDESMIKHVTMQQPDTFESALSLATLYYSVDTNHSERRDMPKPRIAAVKQSNTGDAANQQTDLFQFLESSFERLVAKLDEIIGYVKPRANNNRNFDGVPRNPCPRCGKHGHWGRDCKACFNCKQTGHLKRDCPHLQNPADPATAASSSTANLNDTQRA